MHFICCVFELKGPHICNLMGVDLVFPVTTKGERLSMNFRVMTLLTAALTFGAGCKQAELSVSPGGQGAFGDGCITDNPDGIHCKLVNSHTNFIMDSFERTDVIDDSVEFGWRKIINDFGRIISGKSGTNVDMEIFSVFEVGPASDGTRALYNFGRQGFSTHNLYLLTKTFDITNYNGDYVAIEFDYLPIDLEDDEYFALEVCNDTAEACGVGSELTVDGLNSDRWLTLFRADGGGEGFDGTNHERDDFITEKVVLFLEDFQKSEFIFRFHSRMSDGFNDNDHLQGLEDGVILDRVRATAYDLVDGVREEIENPEDVLVIDDGPLIAPENDF